MMQYSFIQKIIILKMEMIDDEISRMMLEIE